MAARLFRPLLSSNGQEGLPMAPTAVGLWVKEGKGTDVTVREEPGPAAGGSEGWEGRTIVDRGPSGGTVDPANVGVKLSSLRRPPDPPERTSLLAKRGIRGPGHSPRGPGSRGEWSCLQDKQDGITSGLGWAPMSAGARMGTQGKCWGRRASLHGSAENGEGAQARSERARTCSYVEADRWY